MHRLFPRHLARIAAAGVAVLAAAALPVPASAASGADVFESAEVTLRLVAEAPGADGTLRAALLVDLSPGWKTYWIDPGDAGVPPSIDLGESVNIATTPPVLAFPAPHRFGDQYGTSTGYSEPMAVAMTLLQAMPGSATEIRATVLLGVCQSICIPVKATLAASPAPAGDERVAAAFAALPAPATDADAIIGAALSRDGERVHVSAKTSTTEASPAGDLYLAGPKGWSFGEPEAVERTGDELRFTIPVLSRPRKPSGQPVLLDGVVTVGGAAVETRSIALLPPSG